MPQSRDELRAGIDPLSNDELSRMADVVRAGFSGDLARAEAGLADPCGRVRAAAVAACLRLGRLERPTIDAALDDPDEEVRLAGAKAAAKTGGDSLVRRLASEKDPLVAEALIFAMGEQRDESAYPALCNAALEHPDALCREAAVAAIANFERDDSIEVLERAAGDKPAIRRRVAVALAAVDDARGTDLLHRLAEDRDWQTRQIAKEILAIEEGDRT
ncbi:MAG: HEAT repeat domain-containing protein [Actinomycetota bacterium]|nr:HEAT repeat domain-containing protein [Actinomycetota bacterium]